MSIKTNLYKGVVTAALCASGLLTVSTASASSVNHDRSAQNHESELAQYNRSDRNNGQNMRRDDRNYGQDMRRNDHPRSFNRLPNGYRRVVSRSRTYYTQDSAHYYSYNPYSRSYILINFPGVSVRF